MLALNESHYRVADVDPIGAWPERYICSGECTPQTGNALDRDLVRGPCDNKSCLWGVAIMNSLIAVSGLLETVFTHMTRRARDPARDC